MVAHGSVRLLLLDREATAELAGYRSIHNLSAPFPSGATPQRYVYLSVYIAALVTLHAICDVRNVVIQQQCCAT
ncbi:hypothetical protein MycrhDRAFT_3661 [Mycolicibacterium rhodesiae JS60]|nr:hypothetical protein MycrhDRAFT_3661 [Mycolicibacterium rhodesiae JS60]